MGNEQSNQAGTTPKSLQQTARDIALIRDQGHKSLELDQHRIDLILRLVKQLEDAQRRLSAYEKERAQAQKAAERNESSKEKPPQPGRACVVLLLDADADDYILHDRFLNRNDAGGRDAADAILEKVQRHMSSHLGLPTQDTDIIVRAFANLKALRTTCVRKGKMRPEASTTLLAQGFNQRKGLFDFVDVGEGKEKADHKIRDNISFFLNHPQCKHLILGLCHDSGYLPTLDDIASNSSHKSRVTLLRGANTYPRMLGLGFETLSWDGIFATDDSSPHSPARKGQAGATVISPTGSSSSRGSVARTPQATSSPLRSQQRLTNPLALTERLTPQFQYQFNKKKPNQRLRIDRTLDIDENSAIFQAIKRVNLCHTYYLKGECSDKACTRNHDHLPLNAVQYDHLLCISRTKNACFAYRKGKVCEDRSCIFRHAPP